MYLDVGQRGELAPGLENLGQLLAALGVVDGQGEEVVRGAGGAELDVRDEAAGELIETLADLGLMLACGSGCKWGISYGKLEVVVQGDCLP